MKGNIKNLTGKRFGRLTVISFSGVSARGAALWLCQCDCGNEKIIRGGNLSKGVTKSCGCLHKENLEVLRRQRITHGDSKARLYHIWNGIIRRTEDSNRKEFKDYGARGIRVCSEWRGSYEAFREWALQNGYADDRSINRKNKGGDFTPENCWWCDRYEQANSRTDTHYLTKDGITKPATEWARELGVPYMRLKKRMRLGWPDERVLSV